MKNFNQIVNETFGIEPSKINDSLTAKEISSWDSMNHIIFIAELEKNYQVSFNMDEVFKATSLGSIKEILKSKNITL